LCLRPCTNFLSAEESRLARTGRQLPTIFSAGGNGTISTLQSGTPFDLNYPGSPQNRPDITGPISVKIDHATGQGIISGDFSKPPTDPTTGDYTQVGNLGRNALFGPGFHDWDTGMMKDFNLPEHFKLEFRADVFNLLNHPQFQNGSFQQNLSQAPPPVNGIITTTNPAVTRLSSERELQLAVRITF